MYFELQLSSNAFARIVRNRLRAVPLCIDLELQDEKNATLVVDRVVVGDTTLIQRERTIDLVNNVPSPPRDVATQSVWVLSPTNLFNMTVPFVQVKQEIVIQLVTPAGLQANGPAPTAPARTLSILPVYNVSLQPSNQTQGGGPLKLSYALSHVDFGFLFLGLSQERRDAIEQVIAGATLAPTSVDMGPLSALLKRPVAAINAGIACDPSGTFVALRADFDIHASPVAVDRSFFEAGPTDLLDGKDWAMLVDADVLVADSRAKARGALEGQAGLRLNSGPDVSWDPGGPAIDISAEVELIDACPFFVDDIDMDADVDIRASFSVPTANTLRSHFHISGEPSNVGEEIACALTGALLWPFIGPALLKDSDLDEGIGYYLAGLAIGPAVTFIGIIAAIETKGLSKDISKDLGSTCRKLDDENFECNDVLNMVMALSPGLNSRLELERVSGVQQGLVVAGAISNLRDAPLETLDSVAVNPFRWQVIGRCTGNRKGNFSIANQAKITVHGVAVCKAYVLSDPAAEFSVAVADDAVTVVPAFTAAYADNPYPCRVRVVTRLGVRTITLQPPAAMTSGQREALETDRLRAFSECFFLERTFTNVERVHWTPDPPFRGRDRIQFWQIVVRGLQPDNTIRVSDPGGATRMSARPSDAGVAHMTLTFAGEQAVSELSLEMLGEHSEGGAQRQMSVQQIHFEHRATLPVGGSLHAMSFGRGEHGPRLVAADDGGATTWDMTNPAAPSLLDSIGDDGADAREDLVVHTAKRVGGAPTANLRLALQLIGDDSELIDAVGSPRIGGIRESLYVRTPSGATLFDISDPQQPREMQVYTQPAWFEGVALGGTLLAQHDAQSREVAIYQATVIDNL